MTGDVLALPRLIIGDQSSPLRSALGQCERFEVAAVASDAAALVDQAAGHHPEVALLDILIPGDGLWATARISQLSPGTAIVVHSTDEHRPTILAFLRAGALYHVRTGTTPPDLIDLLHGAMEAHRSGRRGANRWSD